MLIVAVCSWNKWIECKPVVLLTSEATAAFFYELIVRFGVPVVVRCDMGTEFLGALISFAVTWASLGGQV